MTRKVVLIGLDGASPDVLFGMLDELPNLARLARAGASGTLRSTSPPVTVPAWTVMTSGVSPARLGVFGFRNRQRGHYADGFLATGAHVRVKRVWDHLSDAGLRVIVHGVPQTFPAYPVNGAMTGCFLAPSADADGFAWPEGLRGALPADYPVDAEGFRSGDRDATLAAIARLRESHFDAAERLVASREWDFLMMVELGIDRVQHAFWDEPEIVRAHYRAVDARIGRLLALVPTDTVVLVASDHGAQASEGAVNVNDWLRHEGLLALKRDPRGVEKFDPANVDWSRTSAWAHGGYHARVFVNLAGREPAGSVPAAEYDELVADLARRLEGVAPGTIARRPDHEECADRADLDLDAAPDLHVYFAGLALRASQSVGHGEIISPGSEVGHDLATHAWDGVLVAHDPAAPRPARVEGARLVDVASTVLRLFGIPPHADMEGRAIDGLAYPPVSRPAPATVRRDPATGPPGAAPRAPQAHAALGVGR